MAWDKLTAARGASAPSKNAGGASPSPVSSSSDVDQPEVRADHRRSKRVYIAMPVVVEGQRDQKPFEEQAVTEAVNAHGCLIRLSTRMAREQKLKLTNVKSGEQAECRVAYVGQTVNGKTQLGLEFTLPAGYFWHIAFPPEDWNSGERKKPTAARPAPAGRKPA